MAKLSVCALAAMGALASAQGVASAKDADPRVVAWNHCIEKLSENLDPRTIDVRRVTERGTDTYKFYLQITDDAHDEPMTGTCTASARKGVINAVAIEMRPVMAVAETDG